MKANATIKKLNERLTNLETETTILKLALITSSNNKKPMQMELETFEEMYPNYRQLNIEQYKLYKEQDAKIDAEINIIDYNYLDEILNTKDTMLGVILKSLYAKMSGLSDNGKFVYDYVLSFYDAIMRIIRVKENPQIAINDYVDFLPKTQSAIKFGFTSYAKAYFHLRYSNTNDENDNAILALLSAKLELYKRELNSEINKVELNKANTPAQKEVEIEINKAHLVRGLFEILTTLNANHDRTTIAKLAYFLINSKEATEKKDYQTLLNAISAQNKQPNNGTVKTEKETIKKYLHTLNLIKEKV